jgi:hypothetical protein
MMRKKLFICILFIHWLCPGIIVAQSFYKSEKFTISPTQIIIDNYTIIDLKSLKGPSLSSNVFDKNNVYTHLQNINDVNGASYQILYQTDFSGKLTMMSFSNNLSSFFSCNGKPMMAFDFCISNINENNFPEKTTEEIINCIMARLNNCK